MTTNDGGRIVGRGIIKKASLRREASARQLGGIWKASRRHLGGIWELSGRHMGGTLDSRRPSGSKRLQITKIDALLD